MARNWAQVAVSLELWQDFITRGYETVMIQCREGLPEGAELAFASYDDVKATLSLVFEHPSFTDLQWGDEIPYLTPELRQYYPNDELWAAVLEDVDYEPVLPAVAPALEDLQGVGT